MNFLFYFFSCLALLSGLMVIQARNPVHSVLFLILVFFNSAGLLILLGLDFFAMIFLIVYVGAIAVLFLFVVMMLNIKLTEINEKKLRYLPIGGLLGLLFLFEVFLIVDNNLVSIPALLVSKRGSFTTEFLEYGTPTPMIEWFLLKNNLDTIEALALSLYTYYSFFLLLAGLVLLVAMIGAILLTMHKGVSIKRQKVFEQNTREFSKTIKSLPLYRQ